MSYIVNTVIKYLDDKKIKKSIDKGDRYTIYTITFKHNITDKQKLYFQDVVNEILGTVKNGKYNNYFIFMSNIENKSEAVLMTKNSLFKDAKNDYEKSFVKWLLYEKKPDHSIAYPKNRVCFR